jgi:hypothetical protein
MMLPWMVEDLKDVLELRERLLVLDQGRWAECSKSEFKQLIVDYGRYEREGALLALKYVIEFFKRISSCGEFPLPIVKLRHALRDLDRGVTVPMLRTAQHNRSDSTVRMFVKSAAAATMSMLMQTGLDRMESAKLVATCLRQGGMHLGDRRSREPWRTVAAWRDRAVKATKSTYDRFGNFYEYWSSTVITPPPPDVQEYERYRKGILEMLLNATRQLNDVQKDSN